MQLNNVFRDWLHRSKITDSVIEQFNIHESNDRIVIPIHDESGHFIFNKYRRSPLVSVGPKYTYDKGGKLTLFGAHLIKDKGMVLWTEGEKDALVAWSHNIPAVSGTGGAMSINKEWSELLKDKDVIICFDNDHAGGEGMVKALAIVPHAKILFLPDRPGIKDISDYVSSGGDLPSLIGTARSYNGLEEVIADRCDRLATWKNTFFHDAYIKMYTKPAYVPVKRSKGAIGGDIARAKEYPIHELIEFNMQGSAKCLWHNEKTASMHYYPKTNSVYCFGCGKTGDAIDVWRKVNGGGFVEAVKELSKKYDVK